jgi:hypothetical protein
MTEIDWIPVSAGTIILGDGRGALIHASAAPRHEVRIEADFEISATPITFAQWAELTGQPVAGDLSDEPLNRLTPLMVEAGLVGVEGIRPPSEVEWALADEQGAIGRGEVIVELLADRPPRSGYWGAPCDGSPWLPVARAGGVSNHAAHVTRIWRSTGTVRGATPRGVSRPQMGFRLVRATEREGTQRLPCGPPKTDLIVRESIIAVLIGLIPAFTFAWFNASSRYLNDSWLNIAVGGIFFSLMTSFLWRPRLPSYHIDDEGRVRRVI